MEKPKELEKFDHVALLREIREYVTLPDLLEPLSPDSSSGEYQDESTIVQPKLSMPVLSDLFSSSSQVAPSQEATITPSTPPSSISSDSLFANEESVDSSSSYPPVSSTNYPPSSSSSPFSSSSSTTSSLVSSPSLPSPPLSPSTFPLTCALSKSPGVSNNNKLAEEDDEVTCIGISYDPSKFIRNRQKNGHLSNSARKHKLDIRCPLNDPLFKMLAKGTRSKLNRKHVKAIKIEDTRDDDKLDKQSKQVKEDENEALKVSKVGKVSITRTMMVASRTHSYRRFFQVPRKPSNLGLSKYPSYQDYHENIKVPFKAIQAPPATSKENFDNSLKELENFANLDLSFDLDPSIQSMVDSILAG